MIDLQAARGATADRVFFYEREFYVLSNFSAFRLTWRGQDFDTSEHAYQWAKFFRPGSETIQRLILSARSAHDAYRLAADYVDLRRPDWYAIKVETMREIITEKADQHEYVRRKLLETRDRELIEDSWRDRFWGWGENGDGHNILGKLWMQVRDEIRLQRGDHLERGR